MTHANACQPTASQIHDFFADPGVQRLGILTTSSRPLEICYPGEIATSNFIRWLLDPSEGHGLGDMPVKSLLTEAWLKSKNMDSASVFRDALSPATVETTGYSGLVAIAETSLQSRRLDVLLIDPATKIYVAIENKFGAKQSQNQLTEYRTSLESMFSDFVGVHIFMDWNADQPKDLSWIPVGYEWLVSFLHQAEERKATAEHVRETLAQFREALEWEDTSGYDSPENKTIAHVASKHQSVVRVMAKWLETKTVRDRASILAELASNKGEMADLHLKLYQIFLRRPNVWERCAEIVSMAPFLTKFHRAFDGVLVDQRRAWTAFSLTMFEDLNDPEIEDPTYPAYVTVKKVDQAYTVSALLDTTSVREELQERLQHLAETMAKNGNIIRRKNNTAPWFVVKTKRDLPLTQATAVAEEMMHELAGTVVAYVRQAIR